MEENDQTALIDWVNTFDLPIVCSSLNELSDGTLLISILAEISPDHFDKDALNKEAAENWVLCANNLKKLLRLLDDFYKTVLKKSIDMSIVDVDAIAKTSDPDSLLELVELVVGAAVMCSRKNTFIQAIFGLDHLSQTVLKGLVEHAMHRMIDYHSEEDNRREEEEADAKKRDKWPDMDKVDFNSLNNVMEDGGGEEGGGGELGGGDASEELIRSREMVRHLQGEQHRLLGLVSDLEAAHGVLQQEAKILQAGKEQSQRDREASGGERSTKEVAAMSAISINLQVSLNDAKRELDLREVENESLKADVRAAKQRCDAMREIQSRLEMETSQMADELDVGRDKGLRLIKAETQIVKYKQRLEEMNGLKKLTKDLTEKNDLYMDQIHELESSNRGIETLRKQVDEYKFKNVKLDTEKFEAISESQIKEHEVTRLTNDLIALSQSKRLLEDELQSARDEIAAAAEAVSSHSGGTSSGEDGLYEIETVLSLREKLKRAERDLQNYRTAGVGSESGTVNTSEEVAALLAEVEEIGIAKREREESLLAVKKHLSDTQSELHKTTRALEHLQQQSSSGAQSKDQIKTLKEQETRLLQTENTARLLEESLKEKEGTINRLEQEKGKLESYAKRTLSVFKDKYMSALQGMKQEKRQLEEKLVSMSAKAERNQETARREERLLLSAMYDLGLRMMDKKIQDMSSKNTSSPSTILGIQRARIEQTSSSSDGQYILNGMGSPSSNSATEAALGILSNSSSNNSNTNSNSKSLHVTPMK